MCVSLKVPQCDSTWSLSHIRIDLGSLAGDQCLQSLWLFAPWPLNLVVGLNPLLQVAALFLMADCHTVSPLSLLAVQSYTTGLKLCIRNFYQYFFSLLCLSLVSFNKLIRCQLLTDPTRPEWVASVNRP